MTTLTTSAFITLQPDISRYLGEYVKKVLKAISEKAPTSDYDTSGDEWEKIGDEGIRPLMNYLTTNIITLKEWLCDVGRGELAQSSGA